MSRIEGVFVGLGTLTDSWAATRNPLYVGVFGKSGGREFPLAPTGDQGIGAGSELAFALGNAWSVRGMAGLIQVVDSVDGGWNDPSVDDVELSSIEYVYLRKDKGVAVATEPSPDGSVRYDVFPLSDDYGAKQIAVVLFGREPHIRVFVHRTPVGLAADLGLTVWLREIGVSEG